MTYLNIFTYHLNPLIQKFLMNPKAQIMYQEKAVPLSNLNMSTWYWARIRENITNVTQRRAQRWLSTFNKEGKNLEFKKIKNQ